MDRIDALRKLLDQDPANSFAQYGLAHAYASAGRFEEAITAYRSLIEKDPLYVAAYYHGGQALEKLHRVDDARTIYEQGLDACTRKGDLHTRSEIQAALELLP